LKLITKNTDYAVRALMYLSGRQGEIVAASKIASEEKIPEKFLKRILRELLKGGFLVSKEGKSGGVKLKVKPGEIKVLDVMKVFQGDFQITECMFKKNACPNRKTCVLRSKVKLIEKDLESKFGKLTIKSLIKDKERMTC